MSETVKRVQHESPLDDRLGHFLSHTGWLTEGQVAIARDRVEQLGGSLALAILEEGMLEEDLLLGALSEYQGAPPVETREFASPPEELTRQLSSRVAARARAVPFRDSNGELWVAFEDASDLADVDEVAFATGRRIRAFVGSEPRIAAALAERYGSELDDRLRRLIETLDRRAAGPPRPTLVDPAAPVFRPLGTADLALIEARLGRSINRDEIGRALLDYFSQVFSRAILITVHHGRASGWMARGKGIDLGRVHRFEASLDQPSIFARLYRGAGPVGDLPLAGDSFRGALPDNPIHRSFAGCWHGRLPAESAVLPIRIRGRGVILVYGDRAGASLDDVDLPTAKSIASAAAAALERCLVRQKLRKS